MPTSQRIRPGGGYRDLRSFQITTIIYDDTTVVFCSRLLNPRSRTIDQMVQAAHKWPADPCFGASVCGGGGDSGQVAVARLAHRRKADQSGRSDSSQPTAPVCSECGKPMVPRMARKGPRAGSRFWGCSGYPDCQATRPV